MRPYCLVAVLLACAAVAEEPSHAGKHFSVWIDQLHSEDADKRAEAVQALRAIGPEPPGVVAGLADVLADESHRVRGEAAAALATFGAKAAPAADALAKALADSDKGVRTCAATALGKIGEPALAATDALADAMDDPARSVQLAACAALEALPLDPKKRVEVAARAAQSPHSSVRGWGLRVIAEIGVPARETEPVLLKALEEKDASLRRRAVEALGRIGASDDAISPLAERTGDADASVAQAAITALAAFGEKGSRPLLDRLRRDESWAATARVIGGAGRQASWLIPGLLHMLHDKEGTVRDRAGATLAGMGDIGRNTLKRVVVDPNEDEVARHAAAAAVGAWGASTVFGVRADAAARQKLLERGGGSAATEEAVHDALGWLARHQSADGGWKCEGFEEACKGAKCEGAGGGPFDVGVTGLALLALLGAGHLPDARAPDQGGPEFGLTVKRAIDGLIARQKEDGTFAPASTKSMYEHAIAAYALTEAYGMTGDPAAHDAAQSAIDYIMQAKNPYKAWRYTSKCGENDTSVTGWCVAALWAAEMAGLNVGHSVLVEAKQWIDEVTDKNWGKVGYQSLEDAGVKVTVPGKNEKFAPHEGLSAIGMVVRMLVDCDRKDPVLEMSAKLLARDLPAWDAKKKTADCYYWYYGTWALFLCDGPDSGKSHETWESWNATMVDVLLKNQREMDAGCAAGSWDPTDRWGFAGGRVYATAINALTLEVYYRYASANSKK